MPIYNLAPPGNTLSVKIRAEAIGKPKVLGFDDATLAFIGFFPEVAKVS